MKPSPNEVAAALAGKVDRRVMKCWSVLGAKFMMSLVKKRRIMKEHHRNRSWRWGVVCDKTQRAACENVQKCIQGIANKWGYGFENCKQYELCQSYSVTEIGDDEA